jgi:demethylmenaquinone methyltransferase / 2-methoxy-6-polyprenyl-1,4-benzoquinol methylase
MVPLPILVALSVAIVGVISHRALLGNVEPPPLGTGSEEGSRFDFIAGRYDAINRVLAFRMDVGWRRVMVEKIKNHVSELEHPKIVDVATGTADVALMTSKMIPSATIIGIDPSNGMLDVGRQKVTKENLDSRVNLQWADARNLGHFEANTFDAGTMAFGIRNVPERDVALCEIYKIMKPKSMFCILEFSEPDAEANGFLGSVAGVMIRHVVPFVGGLLSGHPRMYKHLQNSIENFPSPEGFKDLLSNLECTPGEKSYHVEEVHHMNFGSVQLYSIHSLKLESPPVSDEESRQEEIEETQSQPEEVGEASAEETVMPEGGDEMPAEEEVVAA